MNRYLSAVVAALVLSPLAAAEPVTALTFDATGSRLLIGGRGTVAVLDPKLGDVIDELTGIPGRVTGLAVHANGLLAVACGEPGKSGIVRLYNSKEPKATVEFVAHKDTIYTLAFSPDGQTLATAGYDRRIHLWSVPASANPTPRLTLTDHSDAVYSLAFHPAGKLLASGSADRSVKVWDVSSGKRLYTLGDPIDGVYAVAWSPSGKQLAASGADKSLRVWDADAAGGKLVGAVFAHEKTVSRVLYTSKGDRIVTVGEDRVVKVWDSAKLKEQATVAAQSDTILAAAVRPDGAQLAVGRFDGVVRLIDPTTGKVEATPFPVKPKPAVIEAVTPDAAPRGTKARVTLRGTRLNVVTALQCDDSSVKARLVSENRTTNRLDVELTIPPTVAPGPIALIASAPGAVSTPVRFFVDRFPATAEQGTTDSARTGMAIALPATVVGGLDRAGDTDYFRFTATAGQEVGVHLQTALNDAAKFDPVLLLTDETGQVLTEGTNGSLGHKVARAGQYSIALRDREYRGGAGLTYRIHIGPVPVITSVFPLGIARNSSTDVQLRGVNLGSPNGLTVRVQPPEKQTLGTMLPVPLTRTGGDPVGKAEVQVAEFPATTVKPDGTAILTSLPATADGVLATPAAQHRVRFTAKKDVPLLIETHAARVGSPVDTTIDVLDSSGKPVPRAVLRSVAKTNVTFRDHTSESPGIRLDAWNELAIDDFLYVGGEVLRIHALPKGPDDDCRFYEFAGKRLGFLDTTPTHHAMNAAMYKVEFHPPSTTFPPNGLPTFTQFYRNDDGGPLHSKDSRISFTPPVDGEYTVLVRDANGNGGPSHAYRLTVRPPRPDFSIRIDPTLKVWKNGSIPVAVTATRLDGYTGPIAVKFEGVPKGYRIPNAVIEEGQHTAVVALTADAGAIDGGSFNVLATATIDGQAVSHSASTMIAKPTDPGEIGTTTSVSEVTIQPGAETRLTVKIDRRNGFTGRVPVEVRGLPHGVRVLNIGLNGILITPNVTEREIVLYAEPWVAPMERPVVVLARSERKASEHAAPSVVLKVQK